MKFSQYLDQKGLSEDLASVLVSLTNAVKKISKAFASANHSETGKAGTENVYGEQQLKLDLYADKVLSAAMEENRYVGLVASEEQEVEKSVGDGEFAVCFDPLDGSSLADVNLSVGTIIGVYKRSTFIGAKGDDQVAAMMAVYGPRTTIMVTFRQGVAEFLLNFSLDSSLDFAGEFVLNKENFQIDEGKLFAPGNLKICSERKDYLELVNYWILNGYKLRYSGGMVPDINQIIIKGNGIFTYPGYSKEPDGKLRLLMECAPLALIVEQAGGVASDGKMRILDKQAKVLTQQSQILIGSKGEVERCISYLN